MLEVSELTGGYFKKNLLKEISFQIEPGQIVGLLGRNGAGKSTLYKALTGQLPHMQGKVALEERSLQEDYANYRKNIAYLPERPTFYPELTLREHLELVQKLYKLPQASMAAAEKMLVDFQLNDFVEQFPDRFSKGMQQKAMIVQTFMQPGKLVLLDEPFSGLDPLAVTVLRQLIQASQKQDRMVLLTTHLLHEADQLCSHYLWLEQGTLAFSGAAAEFQTAANSLEEAYLKFLSQGESSDV